MSLSSPSAQARLANIVDIRSLDFVDPISDNLMCCVCHAPFVDPVVSPCGHTFCDLCIRQTIESTAACPIDRSALSESDLRPAVKIIHNLVNELQSRCPRFELGCEHTGERQFIESHVKNDCLYAFEECQLEECQAMILRKDLHAHASSCKYRAAECKMCKKKLPAFELEDHYSQCPAEIITCSSCDTSRARSEHAAHVQTCPRHPLSCTHAEFGCAWTGERQALEDHIRTCPYENIKGYLHRQQQREQALRDEVRQVRAEHDELDNQQHELKIQLDDILDQLTLLFPSHFSPDANAHSGDEPRDVITAETDRLQNEIDVITDNMASMELKQNMALMTETFRLQEEIQSLRAVCHGMRMQLHYVMMDRRGAPNGAGTGAASPTNASATSTNAPSSNDSNVGAITSLNRLRPWMDSHGAARQDTKL